MAILDDINTVDSRRWQDHLEKPTSRREKRTHKDFHVSFSQLTAEGCSAKKRLLNAAPKGNDATKKKGDSQSDLDVFDNLKKLVAVSLNRAMQSLIVQTRLFDYVHGKDAPFGYTCMQLPATVSPADHYTVCDARWRTKLDIFRMHDM